jgi:hypothetical protein
LRFKPNGPAVTFQWLQGTTSISTNLTITYPTTTTTYTVEASYNVCGVITKVTKDVTVEVYADLTQTPTNIVQCPSVFNLTQNTATV